MIVLNSANLCYFPIQFPFPFYIYGVVYSTLRYLNQVMHVIHVEHTKHTKFARILRMSAQKQVARLDKDKKTTSGLPPICEKNTVKAGL